MESLLRQYYSHNTLFVGLLFFIPEPRGPRVGKSDFDPPPGHQHSHSCTCTPPLGLFTSTNTNFVLVREKVQLENHPKVWSFLCFRLKMRGDEELWGENSAFGTEISRGIRFSGRLGLGNPKKPKTGKSKKLKFLCGKRCILKIIQK